MHNEDAIWFTPKDTHLFLHLKKVAGGYCYNCQRKIEPVVTKKSIYCTKCYLIKMHYSFYGVRKHMEVGYSTINYQQHLHRLIFKCNAPVAFRGELSQRIKPNKINLDKYIQKLDIALNKQSYIKQIYNQIKKYKRITERILYDSILFYIDHYYQNNFKNEEQFNASVVRHIYKHIQKTYIRLTKSGFLTKYKEPIYPINFIARHYNPKEAKELLKDLNLIIKPLLTELY